MAIRKLDRTFAPNKKEIRYLNKSFPEFRQSLVDFARVYFPDSYNDFNETSPGMMFIEMASYVGDVLSYYIDSQFKENLIAYAQEQDNIISMAQALGYKPKPGTSSTTQLEVFQVCPALDVANNYLPDERYFLRLDSGMLLSAPQFNVQFRTTQIVDFSDPQDREISVYAIDGLNKPLTYLVKKIVTVVSGTIKEFRHVFGNPERFSKLMLPEQNVLEILKVEDTNGNRWYEVDYLAQDLVFDDLKNVRPASTTESIAPYYLLKIKRVPRRFVTRYNSDFYLELLFGSGVLEDTDETINLEPNKVASDEYQTNLASTSLDPSDFLSSRSYGQAPANTEFIITYVVGGGIESNVPTGAITKVDTVKFLNDISGFTGAEQSLFVDIQASLAVNNSLGALGGKDADSVEEIRQNAMAFFNSQNRLVTTEDYIVRSYAMAPKYGGIAKVFVAQEEQINNITRMSSGQAPVGGLFVTDEARQSAINLYILGYNQNKKLVRLNADVKKNLRTYLDNYRMLTDEVRIMDAFVVNIGVDFKIVVYNNYNMNEVLARAIDAIKSFFDIGKWDINQPIIENDLWMEIAQVDGVQSVSDVTIFNRYAYKDGSDYENYLYDIGSAWENGIIYPSLDPCIFELRYPERDIIGHASQ